MRIAGSGSVAWPSEALGRDEFVELVRREGARLHRDLPWRYIDDPYAVLVSEVMLQQTQVARVEKHWTRFLSLFPTIDSLAAAGTADVLAQWQGLVQPPCACAQAGGRDVFGRAGRAAARHG